MTFTLDREKHRLAFVRANCRFGATRSWGTQLFGTQRKFLFYNILLISPYFAVFCERDSRFSDHNLNECNILGRVIWRISWVRERLSAAVTPYSGIFCLQVLIPEYFAA